MINPYEMLGLTSESTINELTKSYYSMSLLCHPDKGGNTDDMIVIHNAYKYIKKQLENCSNTKSFEPLKP